MQQFKLTLGCILLAIFFAGALPAKANSVPDEVEFAILKKFYDSLNGSAWTKKTNWPIAGSWPASATSAQFGTWYGVTVVNGDITQIALSNNNLNGKLPGNIGNLQALKVLDVNNNTTIKGTIPISLATIPGLEQIVLYRCALSGTIPAAIFNNTNLHVVNISYNSTITGTIPSTVVNATGLTSLILASNQITGIIPDNIGNLVNLQNLTLWGNRLSGSIPASITNLINLASLRLDDNQLTGGIPANIGNLTKLTQFYLYNNQLSGSLPGSLGNLINLQDLQLYTNAFTGSIPASLGNLSGLVTLRLDGNQLSGSIPATLGDLTSLTTLYLSYNQFTGSIPVSVGKLTNLTNLYLHVNQLTGTIPAELGNLVKLQNLYLSANQLTGSLPKELARLTAMVNLLLSDNKLSGTIPAEYSAMKNIVYLYLYNNKLTGALPASFGQFTKLRYFYVYNNQLTGPIPPEYSTLKEMLVFYGYDNQFSDLLPSALFTSWTKLQLLDIHNNNFSGDFPSSVASCVALTSITLNGNKFTSLPSGLLNLPILVTANFSNNELVSVPSFASQVNRTKLTLNLSNNRLDFSAFEPLVGSGIKSITASPQKNINDITSIKATQNAVLAIPARNPGTHDALTWEKQRSNGSWGSVASLNQDATGKTFTRNAFAVSDEGVYRWTMTNSVVTGLTLQSDPITVKLGARLALDNWAFQYKYDSRHRVTGKKMPGADWVYMVYDDRDRVVMTQDGEQRKTGTWTYTLYDVFNRPIITGIYTHSGPLDQAGMSVLISTTAFYETYTGIDGNHGYTNTVFASSGFNASGFNAQTVTYYDNYDFRQGWGDEYKYAPAQTDSHEVTAFGSVIGLVTGVKVKTLEDQSYWLYTANYYDDRYRLIQSVSDNLKGGIDRVTNVYDFTGKVLAAKNSHGLGKLTWQNLYYAKVDGDNLVKTSTAVTWGGASSAEQIPANQDGWVEVTASDLVNNRFFGLSNQDANPNYTSIRYSFYLTQGILRVYLGGSTPAYTVPAALAAGDRLRIAREGGYINFYRNGIKVYPTATAAKLPSTESLLVDVSLGTIPGSIRYARVSAGQATTLTVVRRFEYDHAGRLLKTWHKLNNAAEVLLTQNEYNELGQLINKGLHSEEPATTADTQRRFKQNVDYRYNIRGWVTSINNAALQNNSDVNPDPVNTPKDLFGMELAYNQPADTENALLYNGNISAMKWSNGLGLGDVKENAYNYSYDPMNRLKQADFRQKKSAWTLPEYTDDNGNTQNAAAYSETGYDYDLNGNILVLTRKTAKGEDMDILTYAYGTDENRSNKLLSVTDTGNKTTGFIDGTNKGDDYTYDANGSMIVDENKGIASIAYNDLHLPSKVTKRSGDYLTYTYDATGRKLRQQVFNSSAVQQKRSDYIGEYFYENDTLKFINHEEGRVVTSATTPEYQYFLKDHLGNVRMTFTTKTEIDSSVATLEPANANTEAGQYLYYDEAVRLNSTLFDHTHLRPGHSADTTHFAMLLRGEHGAIKEKYGLAKSLSVMPGDTVRMEVFAKYIALAQSPVSTVENILTIIGGGTTANGPFVDGGAAGSLGGAAFPFIGLLTHADDSVDNAPKAYLNWLIFDRNTNFLDGGYKPVTTAAAEKGDGLGTHERLAQDLVIKEAGYLYIYLSNEDENSVDVFFDDLRVEHVKGPVVQVEDYYPFGLTFNSYKRENSVENRIKFQGQEHIDDLGLNWDAFKWRNHQPDIGRFFNIDPLAEKFYYNSPYAFSENRVIDGRELEGLEVVLLKDSKKNEPITKTANNGSYADNAKTKTIHVFAHGNTSAFFNDKGKKGETTITTGAQLNKVLTEKSTLWKESKSKEGFTVVIHSCRTGRTTTDEKGNAVPSVAQNMSGSKEMQGVNIVAPTERDSFSQSGQELGPREMENTDKNTGAYLPGTTEEQHNIPTGVDGKWNTFQNGQMTKQSGDWKPGFVQSILDLFN